MAFRVQDFRSSLANDGARPNLFKVSIPAFPGFALAPGVADTGGQTAERKLENICRLVNNNHK